jgi:hypothetical protein
MQVLISSGFEESDALRQFAGEPGMHFIHKPYTGRQLSEKIHSITKPVTE